MSNLTLLLIDRNENNALIVSNFLRKNLSAVTSVIADYSPEISMTTLRNLNPDYVVINYSLLDDFEAKELLDKIFAMPVLPYVIVYSDTLSAHDIQQLEAKGIYVIKAIGVEISYDLLQTIEHLMNKNFVATKCNMRERLTINAIIGLVAIILLIVFTIYIQILN